VKWQEKEMVVDVGQAEFGQNSAAAYVEIMEMET
jgi:hypothetical protein